MGDVYRVDDAFRRGLLVVGARIKTDASSCTTCEQFTGTIIKKRKRDNVWQILVDWDMRRGGSYDEWVIDCDNTKARIEFLNKFTNSNKKEESKGMSDRNEKSLRNIDVNDTIMEVLKGENSEVAMRVNKYFCKEIPNNFTGEMLLTDKKDEFIGKAKSLEDEEIKKAAAKKG